MIAHDPADADSARVGQRFEACGDIDTVAVDVAFVDYDVADIDADAEFDAPIGRRVDITFGHVVLDVDRAAHGIDNAGEFNQHTVAGCFDDAAAMFLDLGID